MTTKINKTYVDKIIKNYQQDILAFGTLEEIKIFREIFAEKNISTIHDVVLYAIMQEKK